MIFIVFDLLFENGITTSDKHSSDRSARRSARAPEVGLSFTVSTTTKTIRISGTTFSTRTSPLVRKVVNDGDELKAGEAHS